MPCDYCGEDLPHSFYLRPVDLQGSEIIVTMWCGNRENPDDIDHEAVAALERERLTSMPRWHNS